MPLRLPIAASIAASLDCLPEKVAGRIVLLGSPVEPKLTVLPFCATRKCTSAGEGVRTLRIAEQCLWTSAEAWSIVLRAADGTDGLSIIEARPLGGSPAYFCAVHESLVGRFCCKSHLEAVAESDSVAPTRTFARFGQ